MKICSRKAAYKSWNGVMAIGIGNEHDDMCSNPGRDWLHFT